MWYALLSCEETILQHASHDMDLKLVAACFDTSRSLDGPF